MQTEQVKHPHLEQLSDFVLGRLESAELDSVESHLASCPACCDTLNQIKEDTFVGLVRQAKDETPAATDIDASALAEAQKLAQTLQERRNVLDDLASSLADAGTLAHAPPAPAESGATEPAVALHVADIPADLANHARYRIEELIGTGGMGAVYKAEHRPMQRAVALKVINPKFIQSKQAVERFRREVQAAAKLQHPNIVHAYDAEQAGDVHFLVMEYVKGTDLQKVLEERGPLPVAEACEYIRQAALGLQHAHESGMVHRDIKPQNLMVVRNPEGGMRKKPDRRSSEFPIPDSGFVKILDFGLAALTEAAALDDGATEQATHDGQKSGLTQAGSLMGTPDYMAPEQGRDAHSADIRSDIYSLGCTLYALLSGKVPFPGGTAIDKVIAHASNTPKPIRELRSDVPVALVQVLDKMMAKDPAARFQTPTEVAAALAPLSRYSGRGAGGEGRSRKRTLIATLGAAAAAILAGIIYIVTDNGQLIIDTKVDDVKVVITKGGQEFDVIDLQSASRVKRLPSGKYEVELRGNSVGVDFNPKDGFTITRWGEAIVTVTRKTDAAHAGDPGQPGRAVAPFDANKAKDHQDAWAKHLGTQPEIKNSIGMKLRLIPPGKFTHPKLVDNRPAGSKEVHQPFYAGAHEVTLGQFRQFVKETGYKSKAEDDPLGGVKVLGGHPLPRGTERNKAYFWNQPDFEDELPVGYMTWHDAMAFCRWLSKKENRTYRLPTEVESHWLARAGSTGRHFFGDDFAKQEEYSWFSKPGMPLDRPKAVGLKKPNPWGLFDVHGNVSELIYEWTGNAGLEVAEGGPGPDNPQIHRGGDYSCGPAADTGSIGNFRGWVMSHTGFRVVLVGDLKAKTVETAQSFVLLGKDAKTDRKFATLADAVAAAMGGDTIEIRGDGPFITDAVTTDNKALTIRAGKGFQPVLRLSPSNIELNQPLLHSTAPLVLEGLDLQMVGLPAWSDKEQTGWRLVYVDNASLHLANCRLTMKRLDGNGNGLHVLVTENSSVFEARNCLLLESSVFFTPWGMTPPKARFHIENCLSKAGADIWAQAHRLQDVRMALRSNTFAGWSPAAIHIEPDEPQAGAPFEMVWSDNIIASINNHFLITPMRGKDAKPLAVLEAEKVLRRSVTVKEKRNVFALTPGSEYLLWGLGIDRPPSRKSLAAWEQFWGSKDTANIQAKVRFKNDQALEQKEGLTPDDFRLVKGSPGQGVLPGGKDVGADMDLVGPGAAYENWKKTPAYQEWRKQTGQPINSIPPPADSWTQLFNGKDLTGWKAPPDANVWSVEDGKLVGRGIGVMLPNDREFAADFDLRCEAKVSDDHFFHVKMRLDAQGTGYGIPVRGAFWSHGVEKITNTPPLTPKPPANEWFMYEINARASDVTIKINGSVIAQLRGLTARRGLLALHTMSPGTIQFRKIEIKELPATLGKNRPRPQPSAAIAPQHRQAIDKGLTYLQKAQKLDGRWEAVQGQYPVAMTALSGMALLMEGSTIQDGAYSGPVRKAADWLMAQSQPNGRLSHPAEKAESHRYMFGHGYAMLFLATLYGQEDDVERRRTLKQILEKAVAFTAQARTSCGGWGYVSAAEGNDFDEVATTITQLQGLRAARNAGIAVPRELLDAEYLRRFTGPNGGALYSLTGAPSERPALTAAALAGCEYDSELAKKWFKFCQAKIPLNIATPIGHDDFMHYYYAQALYTLGENGYEKLFPNSKPAERLTWSMYRAAMFDKSVANQAPDGSWPGIGIGGRSIGAVYATACTLTILQLDNGFVPIYQRSPTAKENGPVVPPAAQSQSDKDLILGAWKPASAEAFGTPVPKELIELMQPAITFTPDKLTAKVNLDKMPVPIDMLKKLLMGFDEKEKTLTPKELATVMEKQGVEAVYTIDPTKTPPTINISYLSPVRKTLLGIYSIEGDTLKICVAVDPERAEERPTEFVGKMGQVLGILKRQQK